MLLARETKREREREGTVGRKQLGPNKAVFNIIQL